jgi:hypothetical protein
MTNELRIFISYRRRDVRGYAGWLRYCIAPKYGENNIFRDIERIGGGQDFMVRIDRAIRNCHVVLVLMGDEWASITHKDREARRLDDPDDPVRLEVEAAFRHNRQVMPLLVEGAPMPSPEVLPDSLKPLVRLHGLPLTDARWDEDLARITSRLDEIGAQVAAPNLSGTEILERFRSQEQPPKWIGRGGGLSGARFKEDVETGRWREFSYEVDFSVEPRNRRAWFSVEDFVAAIEPGD